MKKIKNEIDTQPYVLPIVLLILLFCVVVLIVILGRYYKDNHLPNNDKKEIGMCMVNKPENVFCINGILHKKNTTYNDNTVGIEYYSLEEVCSCEFSKSYVNPDDIKLELAILRVENQRLVIERDDWKSKYQELEKNTKEQIKQIRQEVDELMKKETK